MVTFFCCWSAMVCTWNSSKTHVLITFYLSIFNLCGLKQRQKMIHFGLTIIIQSMGSQQIGWGPAPFSFSLYAIVCVCLLNMKQHIVFMFFNSNKIVSNFVSVAPDKKICMCLVNHNILPMQHAFSPTTKNWIEKKKTSTNTINKLCTF